jgi:CheY-like chemotaxis protein
LGNQRKGWDEMKKILLVDDDPVFTLLHRSVLGRAGYEVASAATAEEALTTIETFKPDLVFLDVMMPGKDGLATLRELNARGKSNRKVVVITAHVREYEVTRTEATAAGAAGFLTKPLSPSKMLEEVERYLAA